jgi:hypothetical protein
MNHNLTYCLLYRPVAKVAVGCLPQTKTYPLSNLTHSHTGRKHGQANGRKSNGL